MQNNYNLEEALTWSDLAINAAFVGQANFTTLSTKAQVLEKLNRQSEADTTMKLAMEKANTMEIHGYGRQLMTQKRPKNALTIFLLNA